ncbi:hypothetical protein T01_11996 [Trichinella spiralis]|uniref:CCHC-type domain-containing protein n=1 Tax=Trichinella spiralis TaxID=6334 RepID=A0A0V1BWM9_TRISP|nr:hypothetical protein T01_11996 [Trichinella spiralis]
MDPTNCLKKLEDFFCPSGVSTSNYGLVVRYLLSDPVRCELYLVGQARENSFEELKRELLNTYGPEKSSVELIESIHFLRQRESQIIKQCAEEVAKLGCRAGVSERDLVALFAGGVASRKVHGAIRLQEPSMPRRITQTCQKSEQSGEVLLGAGQPQTGVMKQNIARQVQQMQRTALQTVGRVGCFSCGCLDHHRRDCPQLRVRKRTAERRTMATINPLTGSVLAVTGKIRRLNILLLVDSDAMVSVIPKRVWDKATSGRKLHGAARPMQLGDGRKMATCIWGYSPSTPGEMKGSARRAGRYTRITFFDQ